MNERLKELFRCGPVAARQHPKLRHALQRAAASGEATRLLPGIFCATNDSDRLILRAAAAQAADPDAVISHEAAAALTWWEELPVPTITAAVPRWGRRFRGYDLRRRQIGPELVQPRLGLRVTNPELTVLDLVVDHGARPLDEALRRRAVSLPTVEEALALTPGRRGNSLRRRLLSDSRDSPWSQLEREAHLRLRRGGVRGWRSNHRVVMNGQAMFIDVAFPGVRLGLEFDSWEFHSSRAAFIGDRRRDVQLQLAGWSVMRFTWGDLEDFVELVGLRLRQLARSHPLLDG